MNSAVEFPTKTRVHMGLAVSDIEASQVFYEKLLNMKPTKIRPQYVKFESHEPPINLTLNEAQGNAPSHPVTHFGIQVKSTEKVMSESRRLEGLGLATRLEEQTACCYAEQDKVWVSDPDGNDWEIFVVTGADSDVLSRKQEEGGCCTTESEGSCC